MIAVISEPSQLLFLLISKLLILSKSIETVINCDVSEILFPRLPSFMLLVWTVVVIFITFISRIYLVVPGIALAVLQS